MTYLEKISTAIELFLKDKMAVDDIRIILNLPSTKCITEELNKLNYYPGGGLTTEKVIAYKLATDEYINNIDNYPNGSAIAKKYGITRCSLHKNVRRRGYEPIDYQHTCRFKEHIFDVIDTEEKAYWLGFIFADGYISMLKNGYQFELSLNADDAGHLRKFNSFMQHVNDNVNIGKVCCGKKICFRCRWGVNNRHLWETFNSYGCTPKKSLTLQFPDINIFQSEDLIRHFIRGYFDGDGCISWGNKEHTKLHISVLGTEAFLNQLMFNLPKHKLYSLLNKNNSKVLTKVFGQNGRAAFDTVYFLYNNSTVYLERKYHRFLDACRLYL